MRTSRFIRAGAVTAGLAAVFTLGGAGLASAQDITTGGNTGQTCDPDVTQPSTVDKWPGVKGTSAMGLLTGDLITQAQHSGEIVQTWVDSYASCYPGYNIMVIQDDTPKDWHADGIVAQDNVEVATHSFSVYAFKTGTFTNHGDLGWQNWGFHGNFDRTDDGHTVNFH